MGSFGFQGLSRAWRLRWAGIFGCVAAGTSSVLVQASPAFGRRRLLKNTDFLVFCPASFLTWEGTFFGRMILGILEDDDV